MDIVNPGTVPSLSVRVDGVKILLLSKQEAVPTATDATDFNVSWDGDPTDLAVGGTALGYVQYVPEDATTGLTVTASSDDTSVATVSVSGQDITVTGVAAGETLIRVSIPYGVEYIYDVQVHSA